jgi:hypothetical protein
MDLGTLTKLHLSPLHKTDNIAATMQAPADRSIAGSGVGKQGCIGAVCL